MPRKQRLKNRFCRNSKLSEDEFLALVWTYVCAMPAQEASKSLYEVRGFRISERTVRTYFNRLGGYLYEQFRDFFVAGILRDEYREIRASMSEDEYEEAAALAIGSFYDTAMSMIDRDSYGSLKEVEALTRLPLGVVTLRELSAAKKGIAEHKKEHVALTLFLVMNYMELAWPARSTVPVRELCSAAHLRLCRRLLEAPL